LSTASQALRKCIFSGYLQILASTMVCVHQWVFAVPFQTGCHCCMRNEATRPSASPGNANLLFLVYVPGRIPHLSTSLGRTYSFNGTVGYTREGTTTSIDRVLSYNCLRCLGTALQRP
ncbi:hypothetical protein EDC04DRAFT_2653950, partial [Pisolithus marmoratus]